MDKVHSANYETMFIRKISWIRKICCT